jgi:ribosomal-protein-alanine N-acetyltransferase
MIDLELYSDAHSADLSSILVKDITLRNSLGTSFNGIAADFHLGILSWISKTNSTSYAILLNGFAIGLISLSHVDLTKRVARIGYWLASKYWNRGFMTTALEQVLQYAERSNILSVSASVGIGTIA